MRVTDKQYYMDTLLREKLDLMIYRMTKLKKDNLLLIDGDEGDGKSNMMTGIGYYIAYKTERSFNMKNVFFNLDELTTYALKNKEKVIAWDEGALGGLAQEWWNKNQRKFIKLLMVARKRKHFFIICIPRFFKLNEYFVIDRSIGLVHVYMRNEIEHGRFVYYSRSQKEKLWEDWKKKRTRNYKKFYSFHGSFPATLPLILNEDEYEKKKDEAILSIDKETKEFGERDKLALIRETKFKIVSNVLLKNKELNLNLERKKLIELLGIPNNTFARFQRQIKEQPRLPTLEQPLIINRA
jgi:hypothetical protein